MVKTYDQACFDLAQSFLADSNAPPGKCAELAHLLALDIQQAIEDFFEERHLG